MWSVDSWFDTWLEKHVDEGDEQRRSVAMSIVVDPFENDEKNKVTKDALEEKKLQMETWVKHKKEKKKNNKQQTEEQNGKK